MAVWSEVKISDIQHTRIDSEFYKPHYLSEDLIWKAFSQKHDVKRLYKMISGPVRTGRTPRNRRINKDDNVVYFVKTNTLREGRIDYDNCDFIPEHCLTPNDYISDDSVVVTIIGATHEIVGRAAIIRPVDPKRVTNQNVAIIRTNSFLNPYYLTAYLQTKIGRDQLWRHSRQTEQVNLNCREVERILIPSPPISLQGKIGNLVQKSFDLSDDSQFLYTQAQQLLEKELGLDKLIFDKPVSYEARLSEVVGERRANAEYYSPVVKKILSSKIFNNCKSISDIFNIIRGITPPSYSKKGTPVVKTKSVRTPAIDKKRIYDYVLSVNGLTQICANDLILASMGVGSLGRLSYVDPKAEGFVIDGTLRLLRKKVNTPDDLIVPILLFFSSKAGQEIIYRGIVGTTGIISLPDEYLKKMPVPFIDLGLCAKLTNLVQDSMRAKEESKQLLEQAKKQVEKLIEEAVEK